MVGLEVGAYVFFHEVLVKADSDTTTAAMTCNDDMLHLELKERVGDNRQAIWVVGEDLAGEHARCVWTP